MTISATVSGGATAQRSTASNSRRSRRNSVLAAARTLPGQPVVDALAARLVLFSIVAAGGLIAFVSIRPSQQWLLWLTVLLTILAVDGIVRSSPRWDATNPSAALVYTILPTLSVLASGLFIDEALEGYARPAAALGAALLATVTVFGEYHTVHVGTRMYGIMRLILAVISYLAAFAVFTVVFTTDISLSMGALIIGAVSFFLALEILRESHLVGVSSLLVGLAVGVTMGELRIALYFFPLDGLLAGALMIIGFYLAVGILHHLLDHDLRLTTLAEYIVVAAVGTAAVVLTRTFV